MKLQDLMEIENPTVEQYAEMEEILLDASRGLVAEIARLDDDHRAHASDRVLGNDVGATERAAARSAAVERQIDIEHVLGEVRNKKATLQCLQAQEAERAAWELAKGFLSERRACAQEIESLLSKVVGLAIKENALFDKALEAAPVVWDREKKMEVVRGLGGHQGDYYAAIVARMNILLDYPFPKVHPHDELLPFTRRVNYQDGLVAFLDWSDKALLRDS